MATKIGVGEWRTAQETGEMNMLAALGLAQRLGGWVTQDLVARWVWPKTPLPAARKLASDLLCRALDRRWLLSRPLGGRRLLYVVTTGGARWLAEGGDGEPGLTGTDLGRLENGKWSPPPTLDHDMRAARWLVAMAAKGWEITTGWELARRNRTVRKLPDGLAYTPDRTTCVWLEVEGARKSGPHMRRMAEELVRIAQGNPPNLQATEYEVLRPTATAVVLPAPLRGVDHRLRIVSAVRRAHPVEPVPLVFLTEAEPWKWDREQITVDIAD